MTGRIFATVLVAVLTGRALAACEDGPVVEELRDGLSARAAGLQAGDVLCAWERAASPTAPAPAAGRFATPFDVAAVECEEAPHRGLTLIGTRGGAVQRWPMPPGEWGLDVRPPLDDTSLAAYEEARRLARGEDPARGFSSLRQLAHSWSGADDHARAAWLLFRLARVSAEARHWETADAALREAVREADQAGEAGSLARIHSAHAIGMAFQKNSEWDRAIAFYRQALEMQRRLAPASHAEAALLGHLGWVAMTRSDLPAAEDYMRRSLAIREALAPGSTEVARAHFSLGVAAWTRGDADAADTHHRRAFEIRRILAPESLPVADSLNNLGLVAMMRGDLRAAEELRRQALDLYERLAPGGLNIAATLHNIAVVAWLRGDLAGAEEYYRRSLSIKEKLAPISLTTANSLVNLAAVYIGRGDLAGGEDHSRRALAIMEKVAPESPTAASILQSLAEIAERRGDRAAALAHLQRALAMREKITPDAVDIASLRKQLAGVVLKEGDRAAARGHLERGLAVAERVAPHSVHTANVRRALGDLALAEGNMAAAEQHYRASLAVWTDVIPGSVHEALSLERLAVVERRKGRPDEALAQYRAAMDALDTQRGKLGGADDARSWFGAEYAGIYRDALDLMVAQGRAEEAFHVLERYRARGLLALLAARDMEFSADVPDELDRQRRLANAEYDKALAQASDPKRSDEEKREALSRARRRQAEIRDQIRAASPRLAALQDPKPLDLPSVRAALDPGTVLLSYSIGEQKSHVFAVGPAADDFHVAALDTDRARLSETVASFRELVQGGRLMQRRQLERLARRLGDTLLGPVAHPLQRAERVLVLPDGPLHLIPFAALADPAAPDRYLVEGRPVHVAASATVFAEIKKSRREGAPRRIVAFGAPDYSAAVSPRVSSAAPALRSAAERGLDLRPLPASRREVEELRRLFPEAARVHVGPDAREDRAKAETRDASIVHFACHGLADGDSPLDSSLALSIPAAWKPGEANGLLQAWEIFEQVRIDADLVTLSACGTALGQEMSGEGVLGLTRAFQYAGARSVLATLWPVADDSTADLMGRFYRHLRDGKSKDAALRQAQLEMIRRGTAHPARWGAFQLVGDWK